MPLISHFAQKGANSPVRVLSYLAFFISFVTSLHAQSELIPLSQDDLASVNAQAAIELDLNVQAGIDSIIYEDDDGLAKNGEAGTPGVLGLKGVHLGSSKTPITAEMMAQDRPFADTDLAMIHDMVIEVDNQDGMLVNIERLGDAQGNGLDIIIREIVLGDESKSAGGLLIEDVSNFIQDEKLASLNQKFGMQLVTTDDGLETAGGNYIPIQTQIVTEQTQVNTELPVSSVGNPLEGLSSFNLSTDMTVNAAFAVHIEKVAWVDDGNEFGVAGLLVYQGIDTNGDGIDDQVGPAQLSNMKMETVEHRDIYGESVQAMHFSNINFKADIAINSIYVGQPEHSLGSLLIKGLDTSGTEVWMYSH